ncbi:serine/threonine-protein kinase pakG-like [Onychostoma macrolepis]|uniref:serine/threonine-protein kinase pakG-like n=1 Tax=Onychostoma macrolepis TaxID=369639 RepID=UPI00272DB61F|nr:serine/threonine-protein kinase pakG-like [Onychostoma macrolepis]
MRHFAFLYIMCLRLFIVQSTTQQTDITTTVSPVTASSHSISQMMTDSNIITTSPTHITSPSPNPQSQSSGISSPRPAITSAVTQPLFTTPVVTTSTMAKPPLTPTPSPGSSDQPHGSASAQNVHFGFLLISLMFLVVVEL